MRTIKLKKGLDSWIAEWLVNGKPDSELSELFGTHKIPCGFPSDAPANYVRHEIEMLNPGAEVIVND